VNIDTLDLIKDLEKYPQIKDRLMIMLSVAKNTSGNYDLADDVEEKICEEIKKMGQQLLETWADNQNSTKADEAKIGNQSLDNHSKKNFIGIQNLGK
jgi:hypothetical protein